MLRNIMLNVFMRDLMYTASILQSNTVMKKEVHNVYGKKK